MTEESRDQRNPLERGRPRPAGHRRRSYEVQNYSDLDPARWREYTDVELGSFWHYEGRQRGNGHALDYHGSFIPQIVTQLLTRFTRRNDIVLDLFLGSGTTAIEAINMQRRCIGVEIKAKLVEGVAAKIGPDHIDRDVQIIRGDSSRPKTVDKIRGAVRRFGASHVQFLILHPPYWDIIRFSRYAGDLSNTKSLKDFLDAFQRVAEVGTGFLEPGRFAGLVIGDKYEAGELVPLGFLAMQRMIQLGFRIKSIIVKNIEGNEIGKGKDNNLWRYRALAGGFYIFKHEYVMIFQKPDR